MGISPTQVQHSKARPPAGNASKPTDADLVAHELQTALYAIQRLVEAGEVEPLSEAQSRIFNGIRHETMALETLIRDIQSLTAIRGNDFPFNLQPCSVNDLLSSVTILGHNLFGDHQVTLILEHGLSVLADPMRIGQVLRNLLVNAAKYSPSGTEITIRVARKDDRLHVDISDHGDELNAPDTDRIFNPFERGDHHSELPGRGLGLYIANEILHLHGSRLDVHWTPEQGTVFTFSLEIVE